MTAEKTINIVGVVHHINAVMPIVRFLQKEADRGNLKPGMIVGIELDKKTLAQFRRNESGLDPHPIPIPHRIETVTLSRHAAIDSYWKYLTGLLSSSGIKVVALMPGSLMNRDAQFARARMAKAKTGADIQRYLVFETSLLP